MDNQYNTLYVWLFKYMGKVNTNKFTCNLINYSNSLHISLFAEKRESPDVIRDLNIILQWF